MRSLVSLSLILAFVLFPSLSACQEGGPGPLQTREFPDKMTMQLPSGWVIDDYQCSGIAAHPPGDSTRCILFMSGLHQGQYMLPRGTTPESYVTDYLARDLSLGGDQVSDVSIQGYEDADLTPLSAFGSVQVKAMRCSLSINAVPVQASLTVGTYDVQIGTSVAYLWGIYSPADRFEIDAPVLKRSFESIRYEKGYTEECNQFLKDRSPVDQ